MEELYNVLLEQNCFLNITIIFVSYFFCICDLLMQKQFSFFIFLKNRGNGQSFDEALQVLSKILSHASLFKDDYWGMIKLHGKYLSDLQ